MRVIYYALIFLFIYLNSINVSCQNKYNISEEIKEYYSQLTNAYKAKDSRKYYRIMKKIVLFPDSIEARKALLYYFFEYPYRGETFLYKIQADVKRLGFYEDWEVLDRFYKRYKERYSRKAVRKDSSLVSVHQ
ncbi:MAG: hypothetical protein D6834_03285, partial [Aquificota bacterium]